MLNSKEKLQAYFDKHHLSGAKLPRKKRAVAAQPRPAGDSIAKRDLTRPDLNEGSLRRSPRFRTLMALIAGKVDGPPWLVS